MPAVVRPIDARPIRRPIDARPIRFRSRRGARIAGLLVALWGAVSACSDSGPNVTSDTTVASLTVTPATPTVAVDGTVVLQAEARNAADSVLASAAVSWSPSSQGRIALEGRTGPRVIVTGLAAGADTITASAGGVTRRVVVTVTQVGTPGGTALLAVGDIAWCGGSADEKVAAVVDSLLQAGASALAVLGDNAYENGAAADYQNCYDPAWGPFKSVTHPTPGNHEYLTANAAPYYAYFGARAGDPAKGYYSYELGGWHVVVLNSNYFNVSTDAGSPQLQWLAADLAAHPAACTLAYWHHPRYSSGGEHGNEPRVQPFWDDLYAAGVDVVLNGHDHDYERFAAMNAAGAPDAEHGITEFVVGTGGRSLYAAGTRQSNSLVFDNTTYGVLKLTLHATGYDYAFVPAAGGHTIESGSGSCH